jgi:glycine/D-amino acid oxidase-like deaminating enzyme
MFKGHTACVALGRSCGVAWLVSAGQIEARRLTKAQMGAARREGVSEDPVV